MNLSKILMILLMMLTLSSYETNSSLLFTILMKLLMIKGALFMSMPLSIGAFVMGQGMGFFAGNMMGGYMMLRAANRYHNKEKTRWVSHSGWHGPPYHTNNYQTGYNKGKAIIDTINLGKAKLNAIASIFKPFVPTHSPPKYGPPKYKPPPAYGPPPPKYGAPKDWSSGYNDFSFGSFSNPSPTVEPAPLGYGPSTSYGPPPANGYGVPPSSGLSDLYNVPPSSGTPGVPLSYEDYYPNGHRKNGFSSLLSSMASAGGSGDRDDGEKIKRIHTEMPVSPSGFYTSAYGTPGQEFTGIMTNEPTSQGDKYLRGEADSMPSTTARTISAVTTAPNEILESYLEQRLKAEAAKAEKQKDLERKQEAQQLVQILRKAYLKQLVDSLKEEEMSEKQKTSRRLSTATATSSPFASLSSSIESLFGSRDTRSMNKDGGDDANNEVGGNGVNSARQTSQNLIRDLLINEVFTSSTSSASPSEDSASDDETVPAEHIDTAEVESITERIMSLTATEREELVKGLDEIGQDQEEAVLSKPVVMNSNESNESSSSSSTENSVGVGNDNDKKEEEKEISPKFMPLEWIPVDNSFLSETEPFVIRVKRQSGSGSGSSTNSDAAESQAGAQTGAQIVGAALAEQKQIQGFVEDIRKFFTLLSALDQDQCLQKLVCDVHTNEKDLTTLTQYEKNILTTFKLMKALMPEGEEDSSTKYRYAAVVGETGGSIELCQQTYSACTVSSSQIVELGTQEPQDASAGIGLDLASLQQQSQQVSSMPSSTTTAAPAKPTSKPTQASQTSRRNYVETNQYHDSMTRRHQLEEEEFYRERQPQASPSMNNHRHHPHHHQQQQQQFHRPIPNKRPHQQQHHRHPPSSPQHQQQSEEDFLSRHDQGPAESFFNYGDFSDFFRSQWTDKMMERRRRRSQQLLRNQFYRYPIGEAREEIGI